MSHRSRPVPRRTALGLLAGGLARPALAANREIRLGVVQFGTVQWLASVVARHGLDRAHGFALQTVPLANTGAGRVALLAGAADLIATDWLFVAAQRAKGVPLCFAPLSSSAGGIVVPAQSAVRGLADLQGPLGVAGGPLDKSWLIVQAAARGQGEDLARRVSPVFGAPPLLGAKLRQGELPAVLTFWNFAAQLVAGGCREILAVADCLAGLGVAAPVPLIGFAFRRDWAATGAADAFLAAFGEAGRRLATDEAEWQAVRPMMRAAEDAAFAALRQDFLAGLVTAPPSRSEAAIRQVFDILLRSGGPQATAGVASLAPGLVWRAEAA